MSENNTVIRSMHDIGLAAWFGGNLMGATGLNGAAAGAKDPVERLTLSALGWSKWAPLQLAALSVHAIGGAGLIIANRDRLGVQPEARTNTGVKLTLTIVAAVTTFWSASLGKKMAEHASEGAAGTTEASPAASSTLTSAQRQQKILQWVTPVLTGILLVMGAQQGEQQRSAAGVMDKRRR
ncbi:hypothetical protein DEI92_04780 [Curtobacterium sp. MCBD17_034]|uniref:hypothetical protein n=1 Tax=unclassified Curtobacterium TaxID=257496 RepID=UPI000DA78AA6|nr:MULTISPECIES: hypothetical protein [unclassified Curtobacterium]PZF60946.1 hypothetical protein DEI92_04780 [Curtobacterium sp. MCBD17_034]PZM40296.1 hypothetical protein DEI90_01015 [Curtobacterium sp. MCBD17_031]WIB68717.1 hypothetical protein DEI93_06725 [Curtobacterium sp. MCBD17_035]